jgi:hypothetical protein
MFNQLTNQITTKRFPRGRVLSEALVVSELMKKFHAFYGVQYSFLYPLLAFEVYIHVHAVKAVNSTVTVGRMWSEHLELTLSNPTFLPPAHTPALIYFGWERC